jgi:hypothetical protein
VESLPNSEPDRLSRSEPELLPSPEKPPAPLQAKTRLDTLRSMSNTACSVQLPDSFIPPFGSRYKPEGRGIESR